MNTMSRISLHGLLLLLLAASGGVPGLSAREDPGDLLSLLQGTYDVRLTTGRVFSGELADLSEERMILRQGNAEFPFRLAQIDRIRFPGNSLLESVEEYLAENNPLAASRLLEAMVRQRRPFLPRLIEDQLRPFLLLVEIYLLTDEEMRALELIEEIRPFLTDRQTLAQLDEQIMTAFFQLGRTGEASRMAHEHVRAQGRYGSSALGYALLTELHLQKGEAEAALWLALQPILFSNDLLMQGLDRMYGLALEACMLLDEQAQALALLAEMEDRQITWPTAQRFVPVRDWSREIIEAYARRKAAAEAEAANESAPETVHEDHGPLQPKEDLNLPLENIRRLLR